MVYVGILYLPMSFFYRKYNYNFLSMVGDYTKA